MIGFEYLAADIRGFYFQFHIIIADMLLRHLFKFVESIFPITGLMSACLRHPAHPVKFGTIEVIGTFYLHTFCVDAFLTFFEVIAIIPFILIKLPIVYFDNL